MRLGRCGLGDAARAIAQVERFCEVTAAARPSKNNENRPQNRSKVDRGGSFGVRWSQPGTPLAPKSAPRPSQERLESVLGRPWNAPAEPRESPRSPRGTKKSARERSAAMKIEAESRWGRKTSSLGDFTTKWLDFRPCCYACESSEVPRLLAKTRVQHIALRDKLVGRCDHEK